MSAHLHQRVVLCAGRRRPSCQVLLGGRLPQHLQAEPHSTGQHLLSPSHLRDCRWSQSARVACNQSAKRQTCPTTTAAAAAGVGQSILPGTAVQNPADLLRVPVLLEAAEFAGVRLRSSNDPVQLLIHALEALRLLSGLRRHQDLQRQRARMLNCRMQQSKPHAAGRSRCSSFICLQQEPGYAGHQNAITAS